MIVPRDAPAGRARSRRLTAPELRKRTRGPGPFVHFEVPQASRTPGRAGLPPRAFLEMEEEQGQQHRDGDRQGRGEAGHHPPAHDPPGQEQEMSDWQ